MAKCDLSIQLDDSKALHPGGGKITGVVHVDVDKDVNCKGLEVKSVWKTHGRGNVASGDAEVQTLFTGEWRAGEKKEYRFELAIAQWPPSYHGHYLNVDHYVEARAKIPWAFDPKASAPFLMRPTCGADGAAITHNATELSGTAAAVVTTIVLGVILVFSVVFFSAMGWWGLIPIGLMSSLGGGFWFFKVFLPKFALGDIQCELEQETYSPGDTVTGYLKIRPKKNVSINGITLNFVAKEQCVSGSGSNRTTHTNEFFEQSETLQEATVLQAGQENTFPISVQLPDDAPYSIDLTDNDVIWSTDLRVDIPRWPDWTKQLKITVLPSGKEDTGLPKPETAAAQATSPEPSGGRGAITFAETAGHLWDVRDDVEQVDALVDAVSGLTMDLEAFVERRLLYSGAEDPHVYEDGYAVWAHHTEPPLKLVLYVPHELADEFEQTGRDKWKGRGTIVGWDHDHRRLQIKLERP